MTQEELYDSLKQVGLPITYSHFDSYQEPPFLVYIFGSSGDMVADDHNYVEISNFEIELYTKIKDLASEKLVQDKLRALQLPYKKSETYVDNEKVFRVLYEITII